MASVTNSAVSEFNTLVSRARSMVDRLVRGLSAPITSGTFVSEVKAFQDSWNAMRGLVKGELDAMTADNTKSSAFSPGKGTVTDEVFVRGLTSDGKYGPRTAVALAMTMWAQSGQWEGAQGIPPAIFNAIPTDPRLMPQAYARYRAVFDGYLLAVAVEQPAPAPSPPAPTPAPVQIPNPAANAPGQQVPGTQIDFEDGSTVIGRNQGRTSFATMLAAGIGVLAVGGIIVYTVTRKKGR
jgi:hypothetical protein